jgi:hypothetical protein
VRNEEVLLRVKEQRNILHEISKRKAYWIGHILRRNFLLRQVIVEGKRNRGIEVTGRREINRSNYWMTLREGWGYSYLKEEVLDRATWRAHFGKGLGPVVRQTTKLMNEYVKAKFKKIIKHLLFQAILNIWHFSTLNLTYIHEYSNLNMYMIQKPVF